MLIAQRKVIHLYEVTSVTPLIGIEDYTEGIYNEDPSTPHETAQKNQHNYLLDELGAKEGFRLLDVGCGLGTLLETARERGVIGTGITISETQAARCEQKGLDVHLFNYKALLPEWRERFDGIIVNGSLEHFCQPEDALQDKQNEIYREMFQIFKWLLDPKSPYQKVVTTTIHFRGKCLNPRKLLRNPFLQYFNDEAFHFSILHRGYGGYYPMKGQLEKCAEDYFTLINEVDGTEDYLFTSEYWVGALKDALRSNPQFRKELFKHFLRKPIYTFWAILSRLGAESWPWQFRGLNPPTILYRQTWKMA